MQSLDLTLARAHRDDTDIHPLKLENCGAIWHISFCARQAKLKQLSLTVCLSQCRIDEAARVAVCCPCCSTVLYSRLDCPL